MMQQSPQLYDSGLFRGKNAKSPHSARLQALAG